MGLPPDKLLVLHRHVLHTLRCLAIFSRTFDKVAAEYNEAK